jgi:ABC-type branched-subunit amino acid transport system substrate-binding protein
MMNRVIYFILLIVFSSVSLANDPIKIGMSTALTGPAAALGMDMRAGIESFFDDVNKRGGVNGRRLELIVQDDGYEPQRAALNMRELIDDHEVLAVIGNVGTPTAIVTVPIAEEKKTLLFGAFSGGGVLRKTPNSRYVINYRPSYAEETAEMIDGLMMVGIEPQQIAFFTQRDGYGDAAYSGAVNALHKQGFEQTDLLTHGRYTRNTLNVEDAVAALLDSPITPKVVIMAGGYAASAKFIELVQQEIPDIWFVNVSFVGSYSLMQALEFNGRNVIVTQVVPFISATLPLINEYLEALKQFDASIGPNDVSLEGFIVAKIFYQGLLNIDGEINRESIIDGLEAINGDDIGLGLQIHYDKSDHQAIHNIWLTCLCGGIFNSFEWKMLNSTD